MIVVIPLHNCFHISRSQRDCIQTNIGALIKAKIFWIWIGLSDGNEFLVMWSYMIIRSFDMTRFYLCTAALSVCRDPWLLRLEPSWWFTWSQASSSWCGGGGVWSSWSWRGGDWCDDSELTFTRSSSLPASSSSVLVWPSKPSDTCSPNTIGKQSWHYDACPILKRGLVSPYIQVEQGGWQVDDKLQHPPTLPALDQSSWSPAISFPSILLSLILIATSWKVMSVRFSPFIPLTILPELSVWADSSKIRITCNRNDD